jgi:ubiquinone/menaquinone biosynthesis C-methylase UbiE
MTITTGPSAYDREFSFSRIGMAQRHLVWAYLEPLLSTPSMEVLELSCGTGIDAVHIARAGHRVLATDSSGEMLAIARDTARQNGVEDRVQHEQLSFDMLATRMFDRRFDLVFSDFGGLNCIDGEDLDALCDPVADVLAPRGRFIAVLMPDRCLSETLHHFFHGEWSEAFRRGRHDPVWAGLSGSGVHTWYHAPKIMIDAMAARFRVINVSPIGFFLPPRQAEASTRSGTIDRLARWDAGMMNRRWAARFSDHYLIDLERTS